MAFGNKICLRLKIRIKRRLKSTTAKIIEKYWWLQIGEYFYLMFSLFSMFYAWIVRQCDYNFVIAQLNYCENYWNRRERWAKRTVSATMLLTNRGFCSFCWPFCWPKQFSNSALIILVGVLTAMSGSQINSQLFANAQGESQCLLLILFSYPLREGESWSNFASCDLAF